MQLARALVVVAMSGASVRADTGFTSKIQVYADSDKTTVVSPLVQAQADVGKATNVSLGYVVDAVTSASVDIVSQASPTTIHDTRHQASAGVTQLLGSLTASGGYSYSKENDYLSHTLNAGLSQELFDKNATLALGYGVSFNRVGRADDMNFSRSLTVHHVAVSWTQIMRPRLLAQLTYELGDAIGYQASPYRFVPVRMARGTTPEFWVPETDPDQRWRHAIVLGANQAVGEDSSLQGDYRFYLDNWGIASHTVGARYFTHVTKRLELRLRERFYTQRAATFYQSTYAQATKYITYDRELSPLWSQTFGGKLAYGFSDHASGELKLDVFYYGYADFTPLRSRTGADVGIGVSVTY